ncbi:hypothetical protein [Paenibacillus polymyxa]|uniref:Uncharacterized protein n=1 Tax=Paenibacillus polymyxa (strain SC2) TaxID=886882 RepID=E3EK10_PAEPS|nr:hypothetical protein [Paenibacillus polymyxa]ADO59719.1 hypothetical protein PPSC2_26570 [Paenibacillus polymyxa SC2]WPQ59464.1 hypothetical protein SKN87_27770 [Paenibacillus polymyxa]
MRFGEINLSINELAERIEKESGYILDIYYEKQDRIPTNVTIVNGDVEIVFPGIDDMSVFGMCGDRYLMYFIPNQFVSKQGHMIRELNDMPFIKIPRDRYVNIRYERKDDGYNVMTMTIGEKEKALL